MPRKRRKRATKGELPKSQIADAVAKANAKDIPDGPRLDLRDIPDWLRLVIGRVDEKANGDGERGRLVETVWTWTRDERHSPIEFPPMRACSQMAKTAVLVSLYDLTRPEAEWIFPKRKGLYPSCLTETGGMSDADKNDLFGRVMVKAIKDRLTAIDWHKATPELRGWLERAVNDVFKPAPVAGEGGYASADWIHYKHGIPRSRLSEGKNANPPKIRSTPAPPGAVDRDNKPVRIWYCVEDAIKHYGPQRVKKNPLAFLKNRP